MKGIVEWLKGTTRRTRLDSPRSPTAADGLVWVGGDPERSAAEAQGLKGMAADHPHWRAVALVGARLQNVMLAEAMRAQDEKEKLERLAEAKGVSLLLRELNAKRTDK